jgi:hypothetical protein
MASLQRGHCKRTFACYPTDVAEFFPNRKGRFGNFTQAELCLPAKPARPFLAICINPMIDRGFCARGTIALIQIK